MSIFSRWKRKKQEDRAVDSINRILYDTPQNYTLDTTPPIHDDGFSGGGGSSGGGGASGSYDSGGCFDSGGGGCDGGGGSSD